MLVAENPRLAHRHAFSGFAMALLLCVLLIELLNTLRINQAPSPDRSFPQGFVSPGIWSAYALVRPPHAKSGDFRDPVFAARRTVKRDPNIYQDFDGVAADYVYAPTAALMLAPLGVDAEFGEFATAIQCADISGRIFILGIFFVSLWSLRGLLRSRLDWILAIGLVAAFYPLRWSLCCVQVQSYINSLLVISLLAYACRRNGVSGIMLGLAACLKPQYVLLIVFALVRKDWRLAISMIVTGLVVVASSVITLGIEPWLVYIHKVLPVISQGYAWDHNQSFLALARRWIGDPYVFEIRPATTGLIVFSWSCVFAMTVVAAFPRDYRNRSDRKPPAPEIDPGLPSSLHSIDTLFRFGDLGIAILAITMASPIAWEHHYGWAIALICACYAISRTLRLSFRFLFLLGIIYSLLATFWIPIWGNCGGFLSLIDSARLFVAIFLLAATWYGCRQLRMLQQPESACTLRTRSK